MATVVGGSDPDDGNTIMVSGTHVAGDQVTPEPGWRRVVCDLSSWAGQTVDVGLEYHGDVDGYGHVDTVWLW